jgi:transketolase
VIRPADATETAAAWKAALDRKDGPTALALTRQNLPILDPAQYPAAELVAKGAYILVDSKGTPELILIASGSEVSLALEAQQQLSEKGIATRVVSMPCWEFFENQPKAYQNEVFPPAVTARLAIEMGIAQGWQKYVGDNGDVLSIEKFGASAPANVVMEKYGFSVKNVVEQATKLLKKQSKQPKQPKQPEQPKQSKQPKQPEQSEKEDQDKT